MLYRINEKVIYNEEEKEVLPLDQALDTLIPSIANQDDFDSVYFELRKRLLERMLDAELKFHLGYSKSASGKKIRQINEMDVPRNPFRRIKENLKFKSRETEMGHLNRKFSQSIRNAGMALMTRSYHCISEV